MKSNRDKILFMLHIPPPVHGSSIVGEIIYKSNLLNSSFNTYHMNLLTSNSLKETGKVSLKKIFRFPSKWFKLFRLLLLDRPHLCYYALSTTGSAFVKDSLMISLLHMFKVKVIYHLHNKGVSKNQNRRLFDSLYRFVFKGSSAILLSEHLYTDIKKYVPYDKIYICPNGLEDKNTNVANKKKSQNGTTNILFLSNLIKSKGVFDLLDSCAILSQKDYNFQCLFVGSEGDISKNEFEEYVNRNNISQYVTYLGAKFGHDKYNIYSKADIFVFPTFNDCFPLVLIEAMQFKLPIISTLEGGIPDLVDQNMNGILISQRNPDTLTGKIEYLIQNPQIATEMGERGRNKYDNNYTVDIFENRIYSILVSELTKTKKDYAKRNRK